MKLTKETTKGIILGSTLTLALLAGINNVSAAGITKLLEATFNNVKVNVEGKTLNFVDAEGNKIDPFIVEGTTYLPVRAIVEGMGKSVKWDNSTNTIYISNTTKDNSVKFVASETIKNKVLEEDIIKVLKLDDDEAKKTRYYYNYIDLNGDGVKEVFVQMVGPATSGTGGDTGLIFKEKNNSFELVQKFTLIRNPIIVSSGKTNGWNDLVLEVSGGGAKAHRVQLKFDGTQYPNLGDGFEIDENTNVEGTGIIQNDIRADIETGKGLYLK